MWRILAIALAITGMAAEAGAIDCAGWRRLDPEQKAAKIASMIDGHLNSNVGKRYTSESPVRMRRCMQEFSEDIQEEFDSACDQGRSTEKNALDQLFDRYFLTCVQ
jgi:hypothetical protein